MHIIEWIIAASVVLAWIYLGFFHGSFWRVGPFLDAADKKLREWPAVCTVIPARNEADVLPRTLPALLKQDYPGPMRVILVNDHSADGTAAVAREISSGLGHSAGFSFDVLDAAPLEPGWAGKLWALDQGVRFVQSRPRSDQTQYFFLFTDADILHHSGSVRQLVSKATQTGSLDLVSLMVQLHCRSFWEKLLIPAFVFFFRKLYPFKWSNDPRSKTAAAAGGCILIRASALQKIGGLSAIRSAIIDDCALAGAVKKSGGKIWLGMTESLKSLRSYESLASIWNMVARTAFTQLQYSRLLLAASIFGMAWLYLWGPMTLAAGVIGSNAERIILGGVVWMGISAIYRPMVSFYGLPWIYAFALPFASSLYMGMTLQSAWRHWHGRTGLWKGRNYFEAVARR